MQELNFQEVEAVAGGDVSGLGQAMVAGGSALLAIAALPVAAPVAGAVAMFGGAWAIGGALIWGKASIHDTQMSSQ